MASSPEDLLQSFCEKGIVIALIVWGGHWALKKLGEKAVEQGEKAMAQGEKLLEQTGPLLQTLGDKMEEHAGALLVVGILIVSIVVVRRIGKKKKAKHHF